MPELPEVQTVVSTLAPRALNSQIVSVDVLRPDYTDPPGHRFAQHLQGRTIRAIHRRGKRIIIELDGAGRLLIHLGMTGRVNVCPPGTPRAAHTHLVITLREPAGSLAEIHIRDPRRFGEARWLGEQAGDEGLGIEPLEMTAKDLHAILARSKRPIKSLLLDQSKIAGLGNIYADESLFAARIHPLTPSDRIPRAQAADLCRSIKKVLRRAIHHRGSTLRDYVDADGRAGRFQNLHQVYDRAQQPCLKCRHTVQRIVLAGRSACFCPQCQPLPHK